MAIALNVALLHLKWICAGINNMTEERVHNGPIEPGRISDKPHIVIVQDTHKGERIDGDNTRRTIRLRITVLMRIDPVRQDTDIEINEIYEPMHAALEKIIDGVDGKIITFTEVEDSLEYDTDVNDNKPIRMAYADWDLTIDRTVGRTELVS